MNHLFKIWVVVCALVGTSLSAVEWKIGIVSFKYCLEHSKLGQQEQSHFDGLKKEMEEKILEKEKELNQIAAKLKDPDYLDSLSQEAEAELRHKFRALNQEMAQKQNEYYQILNQANFSIMQKVNQSVRSSSAVVAKNKGYDLILNGDESTLFAKEAFFISSLVVEEMNRAFGSE